MGIFKQKKKSQSEKKPLIGSTKENVPPEAWSLFESALADEQSGNKEEAKSKYEKAVEIYPEFEVAWINLAMVYQDLGDSVMPMVIAKQGLEHVPSSSALWLSLGNYYTRIQSMDASAEEAYRKALEYNPENAIAAINLGSHMANQGKLEEAEKFLTQSRAILEDDSQYNESKEVSATVWAQLAIIRAQLRMVDKAKEAIRKFNDFGSSEERLTRMVRHAQVLVGDIDTVGEKMPSDANAWYELGLTLDKQENFPKAIEAYQKAIALDQHHIHARCNLGAVLVDTGDYQQAANILQSVIKEDPENHIAWMNLGKAFLAQEKNNEGEHALQQVVKFKPDYVNAWYQLGMLYDRQRRMQESESAYRKTVEIANDHYRAWSDLGVLLIEMGRKAEAEAPLRNATKYGPGDVKVWANLGLYLAMMNRCDEAKEALDQAKKIAPDDRHARQLEAMWNQMCGGR